MCNLNAATEHYRVIVWGELPFYTQGRRLYNVETGKRESFAESLMSERDWGYVDDQVQAIRDEDRPMGRSNFTGRSI